MHWRLRTKFLLWMVVISAAVTSTTLLLVRRTVEDRLRGQILADLQNSVLTFKNVQRQRRASLRHTSELVADLPISRALMTTEHAATIQDGSRDLWKLAGSDLLVMADGAGNVLGLHANAAAFDAGSATKALRRINGGEERWWFGGGHLYEVSVQPIYFGAASEDRVLGLLAVGSDVDEQVAQDLSQVAGSEVTFFYGDRLVRSTLPPKQTGALARLAATDIFSTSQPKEIVLVSERYLVSSVALGGGSAEPVHLIVLKSQAGADAFVRRLDWLLLVLGLVALAAGSLVVFIVSRTVTKPLDRLVLGVRALGEGDYEFPLPTGCRDEVAELTTAFTRMRSSLRESQKELLQSERLATIGRMASSISHDLRHHLVAILANAEFLADERSRADRQQLYEELRAGVGQMTDLIDSLLELSRPRGALRRGRVSLEEVIDRAVQMARAYPQFRDLRIEVHGGPIEGWFDSGKLQRVFQNLLVNACEAIEPLRPGRIDISMAQREDQVEIRVSDNGHGIPEGLGDKIFEAFISQGKENGTGLGLTVVLKIVQDHGGRALVESTSAAGTVVLIALPLAQPHAELPSTTTAAAVSPLEPAS